ncbi:hypothetical protein MPSEU_000949600 [Mayamaea pseudoterrestris]|nr:hypothetical protein MPSEU_000949600 [Mayamaea pseudoterrestris]
MNDPANNAIETDPFPSMLSSRSEESQWDEELDTVVTRSIEPQLPTSTNCEPSIIDPSPWTLDTTFSALGPSDEQVSFMVSISPDNSKCDSYISTSPSRRFSKWREQRNMERQQQKQQQRPTSDAVYLAPAAAASSATNDAPTTPQRKHPPFLGESLFERLQSRAQPDAILANVRQSSDQSTSQSSSSHRDDHFNKNTAKHAAPHAPAVGATADGSLKSLNHQLDSDDCALLSRTALAQKRVKVLQLLIIGWVGLVFGWLATFFSGTLCHFATAHYKNNYQLELHFGLWKYTPVDAVVMGSDYCIGYTRLDNESIDVDNDAPRLARIFNLSALTLGTMSIIVLWLYLIVGCFRPSLWRYGVWASWLAAVCQLTSVIAFFSLESACHESNNCALGPGSCLALLSMLAWAMFGWEMLYNAPGSVSVCCGNERRNADDENEHNEDMPTNREVDGLMRSKPESQVSVNMSSLELSDFKKASKQYMDRFHSSRGSYCPPDIIDGEVV